MPSAYRHDSACRELVLRAYINCGPYIYRQFLDLDPVIVHRDAVDAESPVAEAVSDRQISWLFCADKAYIHHLEYPGKVIDELLGTGADDHLILGADYTSRSEEILRDLFSQSRLALTVALRKQQFRHIVEHARHAFLPFDKIKGRRVAAFRISGSQTVHITLAFRCAFTLSYDVI